ncbi:MAG: DedA family protein [Gammaproteobacteria bacterium]
MVEHYLQLAHPYVQEYGYAAVFGIIFVEGFGIPAPGETMLISAALLASQGEMNIAAVLGSAWAAAVGGDNLGYAIGHFGGRRLILRFGARIRINESHLRTVERFFLRFGGSVVMVARFFEGLRQLNGVVAGTAGMSWWRFLAYNSIGGLLWVTLWGYGSYRLGRHMDQLAAISKRFEPYLIGVATALVVAGAAYLLYRGKRSGPGS